MLLGTPSNAQIATATITSNWRTHIIYDLNAQTGDTLLVDTLTILPQFVKIQQLTANQLEQLPTNYYKVVNNVIICNKPFRATKMIVEYRVLPFNLSVATFHKDTSWIGQVIDGELVGVDPYRPNANNNPLSQNGLNYSGAYTRGIAFGSNQDATFNSNFNLQMTGNLGDGIEVVAAISDNNIPIQPQGNTQQLQEFDRIFIRLQKGETALTAGDYELRRPNSYFMNYYKKLQGATLDNKLYFSKSQSLTSKASFAIARGKFARNTIIAIEGNQGPYRMRGNSGERFIIILAGTERVFIDGQLMTRGQNQDYVIDYNRGEITFTPNQLITKDKRITVEFEYNDQNYNRTLYALSNTFEYNKKLRFDFNLYSEQDGRASTSENELTDDQQDVLRNIPDDLGTGIASSLDSNGFSADLVLYKLVDTLVNGATYDSILVYSTNVDSAVYSARFSEVGAGKGNYVRLTSAANGAVFGWVAPDANGQPQGSFEPIIQFTAPAQRQLYTLGATYQINKNASVKTEVALSHRDLNRLSDINSDNNSGLAAKIAYQHQKKIGKKEAIQLEWSGDYEMVQGDFYELNPYRPREFTRDWNIDTDERGQQHIATAQLGASKKGIGRLTYQFSTFLQDNAYTGLKHFTTLAINMKGWTLNATGNWLNTSAASELTAFSRPKITIEKRFNFEKASSKKEKTTLDNIPPSSKKIELTLGAYGERERNQRSTSSADTLLATSFYYDLVRTYVGLKWSDAAEFKANYQKRYDYLPDGNAFTRLTVADEVSVNGEYRLKNAHRLSFNLTYRSLNIEQPEATTLEPLETYLGRADYQMTLPKGWLRYNANYQISSGQEQKVQYNYLLVDAGQGFYTWIDRNEDGIKQIDEFEVAVFQDQADHIRVVTFTDEYIRTNQVQFNQSLQLTPRAIWRKPKNTLQKLVNRFSVQSNWQILRKVRQLAGVSPWNPFALDVADTALVSVTSNIRNSLFFNRVSPKFRAEIGMLNNQNRIVLTTGFEDRRKREQFSRLLWNINTNFSTEITTTIGENNNDSEVFNTRDYRIPFVNVSAEVAYQYRSSFRAALKYAYQNSENTIVDFEETAIANDLSATITYRRNTTSSIAANLSLAQVSYTGAANTPLEFAMLQGLKNGNNYLWSITYQRTIMRNLEINLTYEGRKTGDLPTVNTGRAGVRAIF